MSTVSLSLSLAHSTTPEMRVRYWNAYLLFYEAVHSTKQLSIPRKISSDSPNPLSPLPHHGGEDKLQQLQVSYLFIPLSLPSYPPYLPFFHPSLSLSLSACTGFSSER